MDHNPRSAPPVVARSLLEEIHLRKQHQEPHERYSHHLLREKGWSDWEQLLVHVERYAVVCLRCGCEDRVVHQNPPHLMRPPRVDAQHLSVLGGDAVLTRL